MTKPFIIQYKEAIERGWIEINGVRKNLIVGWKIKKVIDILCSYFNDERFYFDPTYCYKKFDFEENYCLQGYAPFYGKPLKLMLWQKAFFEAVYSFREKATGNLLINEAFLEIARKNGKSTMIAGDGTADLFIGEGGVNYIVCSNDDRQAKLIWSEIKGMRDRLDINDEVTSNNLVEIRNDKKNIKVFRLSAKTQNKDGYLCKKAYLDEAHDMKNGDIAEAVQRAMSTHVERLFITISTNGFLNDMYFDKELSRANAWLNGEIDNPHYLPFLYEQDDEAECWGDIELLQKSNPSLIYGVKLWSYIEQEREKALIDKEKRIHFLAKDCNVKVTNATAWLTLDEFDYPQEAFTLEDFRGSICLGAVDLSDNGDLTFGELLLMKKDSYVKHIVAQAFIPETKLNDKDNGAKYQEWSHTINPQTGEPYVIVCKGNKINHKFVADWFQRLRERYSIEPIMIGYDRWHADVFLIYCDKKTGYGFPTMPIMQKATTMSLPMKTLERDLQARNVNYGNNPVIKYCFQNTSAKIINDMIMPEKIGGQYSRKIDGVVTMIMLYATLEKNEIDFEGYIRR